MEQFEATVQSEYAQTVEQSLGNTLQSSYEQTMKDPQSLEQTLNKLDSLKNTLQKNPEAVLSNSFLDCTLSLSGDKSLPRKLKEQSIDASGSVAFDFTRRSSPG